MLEVPIFHEISKGRDGLATGPVLHLPDGTASNLDVVLDAQAELHACE